MSGATLDGFIGDLIATFERHGMRLPHSLMLRGWQDARRLMDLGTDDPPQMEVIALNTLEVGEGEAETVLFRANVCGLVVTWAEKIPLARAVVEGVKIEAVQ